jgi:hypothetical protein
VGSVSLIAIENPDLLQAIQSDHSPLIPRFFNQILSWRLITEIGVDPRVPSIQLPVLEGWNPHEIVGRVSQIDRGLRSVEAVRVDAEPPQCHPGGERLIRQLRRPDGFEAGATFRGRDRVGLLGRLKPHLRIFVF